MKPANFLLPILGLALMAGSPSDHAPDKLRPTAAFRAMEPRMLAALRSASKPFDRTRPDFSSLDATFQKARIIGLGQETHGSREIFKAQADLFAYLVEKHGVRVLLWEDSYGALAPLNDFVQGKAADMGDGAAQLMRPWRTQEVGDLFRWMRTWNQNHPQDSVELIGIDIQDGHARTFRDITAFLPEEERGRWADVLQRCQAILNPSKDSEPIALDGLLQALAGAEALNRRVEVLACARRNGDWLHPLLAARCIVGALKFKTVEAYQDRAALGKQMPVPSSGTLGELTRDSGMAMNVLAVLEARPAKKIAIFAHAGHVAKDGNVDASFSMGSMLARSFRNPDFPEDWKPEGSYCAVAMAPFTGSVLAISESAYRAAAKAGTRSEYKAHPLPPMVSHSLEGLLGRLGKGRDLIVDFHRTSGWLDLPMHSFLTGATMATEHESDPTVDAAFNYYVGAPARLYDAFILLNRTEATRILDRF